MTSDERSATMHGFDGANADDAFPNGGVSIAPGKKTLTQGRASAARGDTVEANLERSERQLDLVEDLGAAFLSRLSAPDVPAFAAMLH